MRKHNNKPVSAKIASTRNSQIIRLFDENREEHTKIMDTLTGLSVSVARVEERVASDRAKWGFLATIVTSTGVVFLAQFIRKLWS